MFNINLRLPTVNGMPDQRSRRAMQEPSVEASPKEGAVTVRDAKPQRTWREVMADVNHRERFIFDAEKRTDVGGVQGSTPKVAPEPSKVETLTADSETATTTDFTAVADTNLDRSADSDDGLSEAQLGAIQHRKAAEALLREACMLEERLASEAAAARAVRLRLAAQEKASLAKQAVSLEKEAIEFADDVAARRKSAHLRWNDAKAKAAERKLHFEKAQQIAQDAEKELASEEERTAECAATLRGLDQDVAEAGRQVAHCRAAREEAEKEEVAAQQRLGSPSNSAVRPMSANGNSELEKLQSRVAEQSAAVHQLVT